MIALGPMIDAIDNYFESAIEKKECDEMFTKLGQLIRLSCITSILFIFFFFVKNSENNYINIVLMRNSQGFELLKTNQ